MTRTNNYIRRSRIFEAKFRAFVRYFSLDLDAHQMALLTGLNRNTVNRYLLLLRKRIAEFCERSSPFVGEIEVDEFYFGARRIKGKRGRGAYGKTPVFGILPRDGNVYTEIVPDRARKTLQAIIRGRVDLESVIHSDSPGGVTRAWLTWDTKSIIVFIMERTSLPMAKDISTALNPSGPFQRGDS